LQALGQSSQNSSILIFPWVVCNVNDILIITLERFIYNYLWFEYSCKYQIIIQKICTIKLQNRNHWGPRV
jgi:hypothetical protein